ncbi:MAG: InlB B-repeat-containing protein, partial [Mogibacterium sp.]|nr:InlB B-repeat-containing protein [Mogibacterium sp.]
MKEKLRKGIALVVAGALVFTSLAYTTTNVLKASEEEFGSQIEQPTGENAPEEVAQNETPQVEEEQLSLTEEPGGEQEQTEPETPAPKEYTVTIEEPALSGGQLYVWTDGSEEAVSFSGKKFEKKAVEGSTFNLRVEVSEGYELESIHSNGSQLNAVPGREGYYQIANLDANTKVKVTYREVKIEQEDKTGEGDKGDKAEPGKDEPDPDPKEEPKKEEPKAEDKETAEDSSIIGFFKDLLGIGTVEETPEAENDQYEITVIFNTADGTKIDEQVVMIDKKTNKVLVGLVLPETPSAGSNKKFTGWFSGENQLVLPTDANAQDFIKLAGENSTITYVPQYEEAYYAYFLSVDGSTVVYTAVINDKSQQITAYEGYEPQGSKVTGWQFGDKTYAPGEKFSISSDVTLTPQVESSCWVTFNSMGGSVVSSAAVTSGKNLDLATIEKPTRAGFTFKGWSKTPNGTVITNLTVNSDTMLYAIWEGADVDYTIVYWGENANDTEYSVIATEKKKAKAGTTVTLTKEKAPLPKDFADREHFTFSHADSAVISQDGSTAINVYYTRNVYTFTFQREKGKEWVGGLRNGHFEERWDESPISTNTSIISKSWTTIYSFSAKYGAYIGDKFAFTGSDGVSYPRSDKLITWKATNKNVYSRRITAVETMPGENVTFHFYYAALKLAAYKCYYYGEDPNGDKTYDGKKYSLITVYNTDLREYNESDMFLEFEGYTKKNAVKENGKAPKEDETIIGTGDMYFYYTRNNYTLTLNNYGKEDKKTVGFDTSLEQYNVAPERPSSVSESAIFKGWYEVDPSKVKSLKGIQPYNFTGKKMPAGNMVLYAYWEEQPVNITITVPLNSNPSKKYETSVQAGTVISNTTEYTQALNDLAAEGKSVKKWVDTSTNKEFDINQAIDKDTSVVAVLMGAENAKYTVSYDLGEGSSASWSNEQKTDEKNYGGGSFASVWAFPSDAEAPAEKQFLNWTDQNGVSYYPGDKVEVNSNVVLTAQYTAAPKPVEVKYYANDGETTDPVVYKYYVGQNPIVAICTFENPGYTFVGWNTKADGSGTAYPYGSRVKVPEGGISLYAQWATLEAEGYTGVYDGQAHSATASATAGYTVEYLVDGKWSTTAPSIKNVGQKSVYIKASKTGSSTLIATVTLKVTPATLKVSTPSASKEYDGTALTADGSVEGLVNGEQVSFKTTGSQTDIGQSENTYELKWDKTAKKSNYTVISSTGILRVTEFMGEVTVTTTGGTFTYDGKAHGATVEVTGLPKGYTVEKATSNATATNVTAKPVQAICNELVIKNPKGTDVTSQLKLKRVNGSITINKATLTVTTPSASKEYDGEPLTKEGKVEGFVNGETATFSTTGTQTSVGSSQNTYSLTWDKTAKAGNYSVSENLGTLTVTEYKGKIVATVSNVTATYDGKAHGATVSVTGLPKGYTATAGSSTTVTDVTTGTTAVCDSLVIKNSKGTDVTDTLDIERVPGTIVINPAPITITTPTVSKTYDGTALTAAGTMEGLVNGETATFSTTGSQTGVGTSNNTYSLVWDGTASSSNYTVNASVGKLTVNEFAGTVTVKTTGGIFTYDGQAHGATVEVFGLPESGYTVETATSNATATDATTGLAATCDNLVIRNAAGADVTSNLTISKEDGSIVINKATLTVNTPSDSKVYNGSALTKAGTISGFVNDETATFRTTGSQTGVGSSQNTYSITWDGTAKECNYSVDANIGTLTVTQYGDEIVVTATGGEFTYDGTNHKATVSVSTLPEGYTLEKASSNAKVKNVSDGEVAATVDELVIRNAAGDDVTSELKVRYVSGTLKVKPAAVSVSTPSQTKTYDGTALTSAGSITGLVGDETVDFKTTGSQTEVGTSKNTYELKWTGTAKQSNYSLTESVGDLTVSEYTGTIDVTTTGETAEYDGQAHGATVSVGTLPTGYTVKTATASATATDVTGASGVAATCDTLVIENAAGVDVTSKLNINKIDGKIVVTPKALTVTTETASKVYDGNALTAGGEITGFVEGEDATFAVTGTQTDVGSSQNTYSLTWDKKAKQGNYTVNESLGTLTVTESKAEVVVTTTGGTFTYDGKAHGATVAVTNLPEGYTVETATSSATATNVADGTVTATCDNLVIKNAKGTDVTDKLNIKKVDGSITITAATLTVVTPDASKTYDGTPLTAEGSISGFVNGETAVFATTGTITEVGTTSNSYSIDWDDEATTAQQSNYAVSASVGTLTVEHFTGTITATTTGGSFVYDGQEHAATVSVSQLPAGYTLVSATSNAKATNVADGVVSATCDSIRINDANGNDVTAQLNIEKNTTSLQITAATLTVTTPTRNKVYDGTALTAEGSCTGFVNGETATFATTGSQTAAGFSQNTYSLTWDGTAVQSNYSISESLGTLTVTDTEDEIVVTVTGGTFTYDGAAHGATVSVSTLPAGYRLEKASSNATATNVTADPVIAHCDELVIRNAEGNDVTGKLNISYRNGSITINKAPLTVTMPGASKVYDGEALTQTGTMTGLVAGETATLVNTGTQTAVGESNNTYEINWGSANADNYQVNATVGKLAVTEFSGVVNVVTTGYNGTYDGQAHGAIVQVNGLPAKGYTVETATSSATATDATAGVAATCDALVIRNAAGEDVTAKLNKSFTDGSIVIAKASLTVKTEGATRVYNGKALTAEGQLTGLVNGEEVTFAVTGKQTAVGSSQNTYSITWDKTAKAENYTITSEDLGNLVVTQSKSEIVVTTTGYTGVYDGQEHKATVSVSTLPEGYTLETASSDAAATDVTESPITASCDNLVIVNADGYDVTDELNIRYVDGSISISKATLTVATPDAEKTYDGTALVSAGSISGFVNGETAVFATTGSQTAVGSSQNTYSIDWDAEATTAKAGNYAISESLGTLTVNEFAGAVTVTTTGGTFTYDGQTHGATVSVSTLPEG